MSEYTTVFYEHKEYQFKTGDDCMESFSVGDVVPWSLSSEPGCGHLLDGVYEARRRDSDEDFAVVIKDHKIRIVVKLNEDEWLPDIERMYDIESPKREWWTERAWELLEQMDKLAKARYEAQLSASALDKMALLRVLSIPLYDQEPDPEWSRLWCELEKEPIPGQNKQVHA